MRGKRLVTLFLSIVCLGTVTTAANAQELLPHDNGISGYHHSPHYRESEGHPLRILSYIVHPIGWVSRELFFRPLSSFASSTEFTRSFFGYRDPFDYRGPECFSSSTATPDCRALPPYNSLATAPGVAAVSGGGASAMVAASERQVFFPDVAFEFNKSGLNDLGQGRVRQVAQLLASVPNLQVVVEGHADYVGTDSYNQALGMKRANRVMKELSELGIDPARVSVASYGEAQPIFSEEEAWARAVNRRVQFSVQGEG